MTREKLQLNRKFLVIESPIPFEIYCPEQDDGVKRRQGSWQMTIHDLLTKSHYPLNPIYNLELIYDETLLNENETVSWYTTDLNLGEALRGIDGQLVTWNFDQRLNVVDTFDSKNGKGLSKYIINSLESFSDLLEIGKSYNVSFDSHFLIYNGFANTSFCRFCLKNGSYVFQKGKHTTGDSIDIETEAMCSSIYLKRLNETDVRIGFMGVENENAIRGSYLDFSLDSTVIFEGNIFIFY